MPALKIKNNGEWETIGAMTDANTLEGNPASHFAIASEVDAALNEKAERDHTHDEYVSSSQVSTQITDAINNIGALPEILVWNEHYGDTLPPAGTPGRIFFKRVVDE